jgi:hypothetical protein
MTAACVSIKDASVSSSPGIFILPSKQTEAAVYTKNWMICGNDPHPFLRSSFITFFQKEVGHIPALSTNVISTIADYCGTPRTASNLTKEELDDSAKLDKAIHKLCGNSVAQVEEHARPGAKFFPYSSGFGFLGATESFQVVLQEDWKMVERLGATHLEFAYHLYNLTEKLWPVMREANRWRQKITVVYDPNTLPINTISSSVQQLQIYGHHGGNNSQGCVFGRQAFFYTPSYEITNLANGVSIVATCHTMEYIAETGFYQGGAKGVTRSSGSWGYLERGNFVTAAMCDSLKVDDNTYQNPYRIPPLKLYAVLTGKKMDDILASLPG